ncbi:hypothetical protein [Wenyingzhuangia sp. IMCC45467]
MQGFVLTSKFCVYLLGRQILLIWLCENQKKQNQTKSFGLVACSKILSIFNPAQSLAKTVGINKKLMIEITLDTNLFYEKLGDYVTEGKAILDKNISIPNDLEHETNLWEKKALKFLKNNTLNLPESLTTDIEHTVTENWITYGILKKNFKRDPASHTEYLTKHLNNKINALQKTSDYFSISDIIKKQEKPEITSIEDKIIFILQKLYQLFSSDNFYSISMIFDINEIEYRDNEPIEIAENLKKRGYGIEENDYKSKDLLKISVKGAAYIERINKQNSRIKIKKKEHEINEKIDTVLSKLSELGYGQEIIFNEIEELRTLSKKLNKKTWSQLVKGKVMDLALSQAINKETATFVYETLVDSAFKLLK